MSTEASELKVKHTLFIHDSLHAVLTQQSLFFTLQQVSFIRLIHLCQRINPHFSFISTLNAPQSQNIARTVVAMESEDKDWLPPRRRGSRRRRYPEDTEDAEDAEAGGG
jgi:hypothetical protein